MFATVKSARYNKVFHEIRNAVVDAFFKTINLCSFLTVKDKQFDTGLYS